MTNEMLLDNPFFVASTPIIVKWEITKACNLACEHCYARGGRVAKNELTTREAKEFLGRLAELNVLNIQFTGGEPFVREDFMILLELAHRYLFCIDILTNGTLITKDIAKKIARTVPHSVQVSLDGAKPETHDQFRGRSGAFYETIKGIKNLLEAGVRVSIATTFNRRNVCEFKEIYHLARVLGAHNFLFGFVYPIGRGQDKYEDLALSIEEQETIRRFLIEESQKLNNDANFRIYIDEAIGKIVNGKVRPPICKAGRIMITIAADGNVLPCPMLSEFSGGNIREKDIQDIWENSSLFVYLRNIKNVKGYCSKCDYLKICGGGCRAMAYFKTGDLMGSDPFCPYAPVFS